MELNNDRFINNDIYFSRNKITLRNYHNHHLLYGCANELYFDNKDGFITESAWLQNGIPADVFRYVGPNYFKYMYNTHAFYVRDRITFNPNFEELTNRRTVFSPSNRKAMNNEMDLHYFKGLVFFSHISNNKIKFNENLEHITWSAEPELRWYYYNILSNTDLNFYFESNVLTNYYTNFNIKANNLKLTGNTNNKILVSKIDLNTKLETGTNINFFDNLNLYQVISNFKEGSSLKPMINKDIDVIQLDNVINWTNLGVNEKNIIKATKIYEKDNIKYALTNNIYQGDPNIKEAVVIDSNREAKPSTINVPEQITYNGTTYKVVKVLSYAFAYQQSLKEITFPNTITDYGKGVLKDNIKLEKVVFKSSIKLLDKEFLANTPNLKSLIINNGLSEFEIGDSLLDNHNSLENISIPQTRTYRSRYNTIINRFNNEVVLGAKNSKLEFGILGIGEKAFKNTEINSINFPTSLKYINDEAFAYSKLKGRLYLNDGLEEIKDRAFANISENLELIVPQSITKISPNAFEGSSSVTLKFRGSKPTWYQVPSNVVVEENFQG